MVVSQHGARGLARYGTVLEAMGLFQMHLDVVAGVGDIPNDTRKRKAAQISMPEPREVTCRHVHLRRSDVALPSTENRTQRAGELRLERVLGAGSFHAPRVVRAGCARRIGLLLDSPFRW